MYGRIALAGATLLLCALPLAAADVVASGEVRDRDGVPVADALIVFTDGRDPRVNHGGLTGLDGTYEIGLPSAPTAPMAPGEQGAAASPQAGPGHAAREPGVVAKAEGNTYAVTITRDDIEPFSQTGIAVPADGTLDFDVVRPVHAKPDSGKFHIRWWGAGGFDVLLGDVNIAFDPYLFEEHLENAEPIFDYIFITHEHFDHCQPESLKRLCRGPRFKKLFVSPGCLTPNQPIESYRLSAFARDLPIDQHIPRDKIQVVYPKYQSDPSEEFPGPKELDLGPIHVEVVDSDERGGPSLPTCGYLVTHREKDVSFYHTGDLWRAFPEMAKLQGRVDFVIHCKIGLEWREELHPFLDYVQPRFLIPVHFRTDRISEPVPYGQWPPNVTDAYAFMEDMRRRVGDRTTIVPFTAGVLYEVDLPSKQVNWTWGWKDTFDWDDVPWAP